MAFLGPIDFSNVKDEYEIIPEGYYSAVIVETDVKATKGGTGKYIWLSAQITEGKYSGKKIEDRINVINKSEKALNIGLVSLKKLCEAINIEFNNDTDELKDKPLKIKVGVKPAEPYIDRMGNQKPGFASNEIKGYYPYAYASEAQPTINPAAPTPAVEQQAEGPFKHR